MARALVFVWLILAAMPAMGAELVADLSHDEIEIKTNFAGTELLIFGALKGKTPESTPDIILVIRGPSQNAIIRRKEKMAGIWVNRSQMQLGPLPGFYALASSKPIDDIVPYIEQQHYEIGAERIGYTVQKANIGIVSAPEFLQGFVRIKTKNGLYIRNENTVDIIDNRLFRTKITLPSGVPLGIYHIDFFLFENGRMIKHRTDELRVDHIGLEQFLYKMAHEYAFFYGLLGVSIACFMGWLVAILFRRR